MYSAFTFVLAFFGAVAFGKGDLLSKSYQLSAVSYQLFS